VGASVVGEVARFGSGGYGNPTGGEGFGGAIRVGTAIADRWGIDMEFTRPGQIEEDSPYAYLAGGLDDSILGLISGAFPPSDLARGVVSIGSSLPTIPFAPTIERRYSTFSVMPYVRQTLGSRADIVYLGGVAFVRVTTKAHLNGSFRFMSLPYFEEAYAAYSAAPAVGLDVRVSMTEQMKLVPGMRMVAINDGGRTGWLMRPSVGLQWTF
jgi:opacity protein-like surface antigen